MAILRLLGPLVGLLVCAPSVVAEETSIAASAQPGCEDWLTQITPKFSLTIDERADHRAYILELQNEIDARTLGSHLPQRPTHIQGIVNFEQVMFYLAQGNSNEIVPLIRTAATLVDGAHQELVSLAKEISVLHKNEKLDDKQAASLVNAELRFLSASQIFGDNYGFVKNTVLLLESVANGKGVPDMSGMVTYSGTDAQMTDAQVILDLSGEASIETAKEVLDFVWRWNGFADATQLRAMFANNRYALRAKLERDVTELRSIKRLWRRASYFWAQVLMSGTDKIPYLPEKYRQLALRLAGLQANQFMKDLYLGHIQSLVDISRRRTPDGKLVVINDARTQDVIAKAVRDRISATVANDLLTTYSRLGYFTESWQQLKAVIKAKAAKDPSYQRLLNKIEAADKAGASAGDMPYLHRPNNGQELQLLLAQTAYLIGTEEGVRHWIYPFVQNLLH